MSLRERMKATADKVRAIASRPGLDQRPTSVTIRTRTWLGGRRGAEGGTNDADLLLVPTPRVRELSTREIASSVGRYVAGDVMVEQITPAYAGGGYTEAQLAPLTTTGNEIIYVLAGDVSGEFARVDLSTDDPHGWTLVLRRRRT